MDLGIAEKRALVLAASRGLGLGIAKALAAEGVHVLICGRTEEKLKANVAAIVAAGGKADYVVADLADAHFVDTMLAAVHHTLGGIDILVNNAAIRKEGVLDNVSLAEWQDVLSIMLDGAFLCSKACVPSMRARGGGTIINIGGLTGHSGAKQRIHVVTGKAALAGFTKALAHDLAADHITANCVVPGLIETERGQHSAVNPQHHKDRVRLMDRFGRPDEVAAMVRYLCGPQARYITGQSMHVNGGVLMP